MKKYSYIFFLGICVVFKLNANSSIIPYAINQKDLVVDDNAKTTSFLIGGHFYGAPGIQSVYPSSSVTMNTTKINNLESSFLILLGDNYRCIDSISVNNFKRYFLNKIEIPVFNAVGNHDLMPDQGERYYDKDYDAYEQHFGQTYYKFQVNKSLFLILDSEKANGSIKGKQLAFFKASMEQLAQADNSIRHVFICSHQDIWQGIQNNFNETIQPLLEKVKNKGVEVFLFSGDMSRAVAELCKKEKNGIQYIHTHISDTRNDKILKVNIDSNQVVGINAISIEQLEISEIPTCQFYTMPTPPPLTMKDIIDGLTGKFKLKDFWYGIIFSTLILLTFVIGKFVWKKII